MTEKFLQKLDINNHQYNIYSLDTFEKNSSFSKHFPFSYRVLLENLIRTSISEEHLFEKAKLLYSNLKSKNNVGEIDFGRRDRALVTRDIAAGKRNTENKSNPRGLSWQVEAGGCFSRVNTKGFWWSWTRLRVLYSINPTNSDD